MEQEYKIHLNSLKQTPGWKLVERWVEDQSKPIETQLKTYPCQDIEWKQGYLKGLNFILQKVEEGSK